MNDSQVQKFLKSELSFYVTIIVTTVVWVFSFSAMYYGVMNQLNLQGQKMETHIISTADEGSRLSYVEKILYSLTHNDGKS